MIEHPEVVGWGEPQLRFTPGVVTLQSAPSSVADSKNDQRGRLFTSVTKA